MELRFYVGLDRRGLEKYESEDHPFQITPVGVIIEMGRRSEALIPWHRVYEISSIDRGTIAASLATRQVGTELL
jgi:uncharacterized protein (UPF0248 family)